MSTWEERMSIRAKARMAAAEAQERANDPHREHHAHLAGTSVYCSCGEFQGVTCVAFDSDYNAAALSCRICGETGVVALGGA